MRTQCPECEKIYSVPTSTIGKTGRSDCGAKFTIADVDAELEVYDEPEARVANQLAWWVVGAFLCLQGLAACWMSLGDLHTSPGEYVVILALGLPGGLCIGRALHLRRSATMRRKHRATHPEKPVMQMLLSNNFHNTTVRTASGFKTPAEVAKIKRDLCGSDDCQCGDDLGMRGPQPHPNAAFRWNSDGSVLIEVE